MELLLTHMQDLAERAKKVGVAHSKFLTPAQAAEVAAAYKTRSDVDFLLDGGFFEFERAIAVFRQPDWGVYDRTAALAALRFEFREQDALRHQDVLGAILGLGLSREVLGDIALKPGRAYTVCLASMAGFICDQLEKIGRIGIKAAQIPIIELPNQQGALVEKQATVASPRLDAVLAAAFNWSRGDANDAIRAGRVQLCHRECLDAAKTLSAGDIVSVKKKGRFKLVAINDLSRKGRLRIVLGLY